MSEGHVVTAVRPPKHSTIYQCFEPICRTGAAYFDFACQRHWNQLKPQTQQDIIETVGVPGTVERVRAKRDALEEWRVIRWVESLKEPSHG